MVTQWTLELKAQVRELWTKGVSASQIAVRLGVPTRNAIIGIVYRMGLSLSREEQSKRKANNSQGKIQRARRKQFKFGARASQAAPKGPGRLLPSPAAVLAPLIPDPPQSERVAFLEASEHQCRWLFDDGFICARHTHNGSSWCPSHHRTVFKPESKRRVHETLL